MKSMIIESDAKTDMLSAIDRCDKCNSQAYYWAEGVGGDLMFCGHHFSKFETKIREWAFSIVDEYWKVNAKSESSA